MNTIRARIDDAKQKDFVSVAELALLTGISERTIWRRLPKLKGVIRTGRVVRIHRVRAVQHLLHPESNNP